MMSEDTAACIDYGKHLLALGDAHGPAILNGMSQWPSLGAFTCYPHRHGASTVDYLLAPISFIPHIRDFTIFAHPIGVSAEHILYHLIAATLYSYPPCDALDACYTICWAERYQQCILRGNNVVPILKPWYQETIVPLWLAIPS